MKTDKKLFLKNNKIITDCENIEDFNQQGNLGSPNLVRNNLQNIIYEPEIEHIKQINSVLSKAPNLNVEIISSSVEPKGLILQITPLGLINSNRKTKDGITYFGYEKDRDAMVLYIIYL